MDWFTLSEWIVRLVMIPVVAYRRRLTSALGWLAIVFVFPWIGAPLYVLLAEHRRTRRVRRHTQVQEAVRTEEHLAFQDRYAAEDPLGEGSLGELTRRLGGFGVVRGNSLEVLADQEETVDRLVADVDAAREQAHLLFYTIQADSTGRRVADALRRAAARGVTCRVLADAVGSRRFHWRLAPELRRHGVDVRSVLPFGLLLRRLRPLDLRNHRKLAVVDGRVAYMGSMNLVESGTAPGEASWHDVLIRLRGPVVRELELVFHEDWEYNTDASLGEAGLEDDPCVAGDVVAQVVPSGPGARGETIHNLMVAAFGQARSRIRITTPYFIPDAPTRVALRLAAYRGVEVDVVVPRRSDSRFVTAAGRSYYEEFLDAGVRIREFQSGLLHSKTVTIDRKLALVGSANFDRRSFYLNFELNLLLYGEEAVEPVIALQDAYLGDTRPLDAEEWAKRPLWRRLGGDIARLLSPLL